MHKEMFAIVDQKHQHTKTSLQSFRQQLNLTTNLSPRPAEDQRVLTRTEVNFSF